MVAGGPAAVRPRYQRHRGWPGPGRPVAGSLRCRHSRGGSGRGSAGRVRRGVPDAQGPRGAGRGAPGYFVAGLGAAQFALPGAVDRLRAARSSDDGGESGPAAVVALAATDPAQPYGSVLAWPASKDRPVRAAGAQVVQIDGRPAVELERGGRSLVTFDGAADTADTWIEALIGLAKDGRTPRLEIARADGNPINETLYADHLAAAGFKPGYRGLTWQG